MTKEEYWGRLIKKNPRIVTHKIVMKPENFKAFFEQVWQKASEQREQKTSFSDFFRWV